ncbi:MAG: hypothetical protein MJ187_00350 [Alphaproteobacteria bacterium]|nr:hypothetical protein [Alphaproteobacteria bacterium]
MALKPRYKRRIIWTTLTILSAGVLALVIVPPMTNLNKFKPNIEHAITEQTGVNVQITGDVNFSLLGHATIVAHNVIIPMGSIDSLMIRIPISSLVNLGRVPLNGSVIVNGANIKINSFDGSVTNKPIEIKNSVAHFKGKEYEIIRGTLNNGQLNGIVRTNQHKYEITFHDDVFNIKNNNDHVDITGRLFTNGTASGNMSFNQVNVNKWFEFDNPTIGKKNLDMDFDWDGEYGFSFNNIKMENITGNITLSSNGAREINLHGKNVKYDMSFLLQPTHLFYNTKFDLDLYGNLSFGPYDFEHILIQAHGTEDSLNIINILADNVKISGGYINANGAHDIKISTPFNGHTATCIFNGTPNKWTCSEFTFDKMYGTINVDNGIFNVSLKSNQPMPQLEKISQFLNKIGNRGHLDFDFSDAGGWIDINPDNKDILQYRFARGKTLRWANTGLYFIPEFMMDQVGDFIIDNDAIKFTPYSKRWNLIIKNHDFVLTGTNIKDWLLNIDTQSINDFSYVISGTYSNDAISGLQIKIANHTFSGSASGNVMTLKTPVLNLDTFTNQYFIDNYAEIEFLAQSPILIPFEIPVSISLSADTLIFNGTDYKNFVYSLKSGVQTFSIADNNRGRLLATINKKSSTYDISVQLNQFKTSGNFLKTSYPISVYDSTITADIQLQTNGYIAHDIFYNLAGYMDILFDGGYLDGIGIDNFYASANNITKFNAEYALSAALESGKSQIKKMHIIGKYKHDYFKTTRPLELQMRHVDAIGNLEIIDNKMNTELNMKMRGTSPAPMPIRLIIGPTGKRNYSLTEIMTDMDPSFLRGFVNTHNKF